MNVQDVVLIIQTVIGFASLIISIITLSKVNQIYKTKKNKTVNRQTSLGKNNKQKIQN